MKPYQKAIDVVIYMKKYGKNKPINIDAITEFFKGGAIQELEKIKGSSINDYYQSEDAREWFTELNSWLCCWYTWIYG